MEVIISSAPYQNHHQGQCESQHQRGQVIHIGQLGYIDHQRHHRQKGSQKKGQTLLPLPVAAANQHRMGQRINGEDIGDNNTHGHHRQIQRPIFQAQIMLPMGRLQPVHVPVYQRMPVGPEHHRQNQGVQRCQQLHGQRRHFFKTISKDKNAVAKGYEH